MTVLGGIARSGWRTVSFGRVVNRRKVIGGANLEPLSVYLEAGVVPRRERNDNHNVLGDNLDRYLVVEPGDIVFNRLRTWQGGLGVSSYTGIVSPAYIVCRPLKEVDSRFLHYLLRSDPYLNELTRLSKFMPPSQFDIVWDDLKVMQVTMPNIREQRAIASFLDGETERIDALVAKKRQLVVLLEEKVESLIRQRIGKSGIAQGATGATVTTIRKVLRKLERPPMSNETVTAFRDGQVTARSLRRAEGYTESWTENSRLQGVREGDVVVHGLDGFAGAIGTSEADGVCSPVYHVCATVGGSNSVYVGRMLHVLAKDGYLGLFSSSTRERAVDFRNWDLFGRIPIPNVPAMEQLAVAEMITRIVPLKVAVERSADLARERKRALITAAVTGEMEVPGVS